MFKDGDRRDYDEESGEQLFDLYRNGEWWRATGYEEYQCGCWWLEYENSHGDIDFFHQ